MSKPKPNKEIKRFGQRHNGMIPDREDPATRKHSKRESVAGTISELKSVFGKKRK